ncbi:L-tyrosine/L-tryptophan isonitrile synthase family protein [Patescibacteria group bacterium]|nr:L-tyrosine/L-tryptophan isonitrile synthase family protein [Patescibacteria group bacterium]
MKINYFNKLLVHSLISSIQPFEVGLEQKKYKTLKKIRISDFQLKEFVKKIQRISDVDFRFDKNLDIASNILRIFQNPEIRAGKIKYIKNFRKTLTERIDYFIKKRKSIEFTILGLPFKSPNLLKTTRRKPDLGELGFILRLFDITQLIYSIYKPGAKFIILTEGVVFHNFFGISKREAVNYCNYVNEFIKELGITDTIRLHDLAKITTVLPEFRKKYKENLREISKKFNKGNKIIREKIEGLFPTLFTSINSRAHSLEDLFDVYNLNIKDKELPAKFRKIRNDLYKTAIETDLKYYAFHKTRYDINLEEKFLPRAIRCTLTPKPGSLGIFAINKETELLPHHGVGILTKEKKITVKYEADIRRKGNYRAVDILNERTPFYYEEN